jgi:hypothetical protein
MASKPDGYRDPEDAPKITEAEYAATLPRRMQEIADDLTAVLPDWAREAGLRFDWTAGP